jgi:hypothetical protein
VIVGSAATLGSSPIGAKITRASGHDTGRKICVARYLSANGAGPEGMRGNLSGAVRMPELLGRSVNRALYTLDFCYKAGRVPVAQQDRAQDS